MSDLAWLCFLASSIVTVTGAVPFTSTLQGISCDRLEVKTSWRLEPVSRSRWRKRCSFGGGWNKLEACIVHAGLPEDLGNGNINIASLQTHPRPQPDLSSLAHGAGGQVIMDAVIDEHGRISQLTLVHGLGDGIDDTVLSTVRGWTFNPATKDGKPIPSEQEILLYYERG